MNKNKNKIRALFGVIVFMFVGLFISNNVSAITETWEDNTIIQKATLTGLRRCYSTGKIKDKVNNIEHFTTFDDVIESSDGNYIALPSGLTDVESDNTIRCGTLFMGGGSDGDNFKGLFALSGKPSKYKDLGGDEGAKKTLLEGMGYTRVQSASTDNNCVYFIYDYKNTSRSGFGTNTTENTAMTKNICLNNDGKLSAKKLPTTTCKDTGNGYGGFGDRKNGSCDVLSVSASDNLLVMSWRLEDTYSGGMSGKYEFKRETLNYDDYGSWGAFKNKLKTLLSSDFACNLKSCNDDWIELHSDSGTYKFQREEGGVQENNPDDTYEIKGGGHHGGKMGVAADKAISFLSSYQGYDALKFSKAEKLSYYLLALQHWIFKGQDLSGFYKCDVADYVVYGYKKININPQTRAAVSNCVIDPNQKVHDYIFGFTTEDYFDASGGTKIYFDDLIEKINKLSEEVSQEELAEVPVSEGESSDVEVEATCGNSGGAESLGWIVCPILEWMRNAATDVYNNALEPALNVEPKLFTEGGATHDAWESFRNMANILFTILFLIVIFSQLTGVGIDNYGIKKILPKLIIVAVLINLSYIICIICVDLSNIIGNGLHGFFDGLNAGTMNAELSAKIQGSGAGATTLTAVVLLFVLGGGFLVVWKNPGILIALLVGALGVVIAIFFVFILLAAREAAIVVLTVISPLAVVCYMLPNTKKLFDRCMKFWEGLLLLYPICGALIGGGNFVSKLLLSTGLAAQGFWSAFVAMVVGVMPIFFIPTVLKSSFAAMGAMGAKITGFGDRMRSGATRGMRNSNLYQDAQKRSQARNQRISARRRAGIKLDKDGNVVESRRPTARLRRRMAGTWVGRRLGMEAAMGQSMAAFLRQESDRRNDIESLSMDAANVQFIKDANAREQRRAEASVGVARISQDTAMQRARASREAQALKAFQDQYANMSRDQLRAEAGGITSWRGGADGSQRASALISAMESRGMENDIYSMLERDNSIHGDSAVMSTLAGSKNKVLKAFGKTSSTDFASFMSGTGAGSMQGYISGKGREFLNGIDDKSLGAIAARNSDALSTGLLAEAAASLDNADALAAVNDMLRNRSDVTMSGAQLASYNAATIAAIQQSGGRNIDALLKASDDIAADPKLVNRLDTNTRGMINAIRTSNGRREI